MHPGIRPRLFGTLVLALASSTCAHHQRPAVEHPPAAEPSSATQPPAAQALPTAQQPATQSPAAAAQAPTARPTDAQERPAPTPDQLAHGQQIFKSNCSFCHGSDARGGETGPNLVRDQIVLNDQHGELITPIVQNGIPAKGMPRFALSAADITDIAAWLHAQPLSDRGAPSKLDILVGDARAGEAYFNGAGHCTQCHSITGDLAGIGGRFEPKTIQNLLVSGGTARGFGRREAAAGAAPPKIQGPTVAVTLPSGEVVRGDLDHVSAFVVALRLPDGRYRSFARHGSTPKVEITRPNQWHIDMLPKWRDTDIHNLTAYLVTLK